VAVGNVAFGSGLDDAGGWAASGVHAGEKLVHNSLSHGVVKHLEWEDLDAVSRQEWENLFRSI